MMKRGMQLFEYRSVRYWFKEIDGTLSGGRKKVIFGIAVLNGAKVVSRLSVTRSIRGPEVSLGSLRVDTRHGRSPTPHTPVLGSYLPILLAVQITSA